MYVKQYKLLTIYRILQLARTLLFLLNVAVHEFPTTRVIFYLFH